MKTKNLALVLILLSTVIITFSCSSDEDSSNPDPNIIGLWKLKSTTYNVTSNNPSASAHIKNDMEKGHSLLRDSMQFFSNGSYMERLMIVPHPYLPENESSVLSQFTFKTRNNILEVIPNINSSIPGFKARYKTFDFTELSIIPEMEVINYYKSGRYLHAIGLDSTKVSVSAIEIIGYYEKIIYYTDI